MQLPKIGSKLSSAMGSGLSSGLGSGSTRARDYSDLFYHRGASQGSARGWLNSGLDLRLNSAWLGLALHSSVGERTALSWVVSARLRSVLTSIRLVSVRFSGYGSARL